MLQSHPRSFVKRARKIIFRSSANNFHGRRILLFIPFGCAYGYRRASISTRGERDRLALRREYKNMCLSPQSARLRSDLHEKTKTCFRGIHSSSRSLSRLSSSLFTPLASSTRCSLPVLVNTLCTRSANAAKGKAGSARLARGTLHFTMTKILRKASGSRASAHAQLRLQLPPPSRRFVNRFGSMV